MTYAKFLCLLTLIPLASCGGSGGGEQGEQTGIAFIEFDPIAPSPNGAPPDSVTELNGDETRILNYGGPASFRTERTISRDAGDFAAYIGQLGSPIYFEGETADGAGAATVTAFVDQQPVTRNAGAALSRDAGSTPERGSATFQGDYVGFLSRNSLSSDDGLTESIITGDVIIEANFETLAVSGDITNRARFLSANGVPAGTMLPVVLLEQQNTRRPSTTNRSVFSGFTVGGGLNQVNAVPAGPELRGAYDLAFTGEGATGVVGTVRIEHSYDQLTPDVISSDFTEMGAIVANR